MRPHERHHSKSLLWILLRDRWNPAINRSHYLWKWLHGQLAKCECRLIKSNLSFWFRVNNISAFLQERHELTSYIKRHHYLMMYWVGHRPPPVDGVSDISNPSAYRGSPGIFWLIHIHLYQGLLSIWLIYTVRYCTEKQTDQKLLKESVDECIKNRTYLRENETQEAWGVA